MTTETTWVDKTRATLQWYRVPIGALIVAAGVYAINSMTIWLWVGMALTLFGEFFQLWAASQLKKDMVLATAGPYSHVRNPMYFGRFFVLLGFSVMVQQSALLSSTIIYHVPTLVVGYVVLFAAYVNGRVGREEARLRGLFGDEYINYCKEVPRFFPRLRPYSKASHNKWQWSQIVHNHEYLNLVASIIVFGLIIARIKYF